MIININETCPSRKPQNNYEIIVKFIIKIIFVISKFSNLQKLVKSSQNHSSRQISKIDFKSIIFFVLEMKNSELFMLPFSNFNVEHEFFSQSIKLFLTFPLSSFFSLINVLEIWWTKLWTIKSSIDKNYRNMHTEKVFPFCCI